MIIEDVNGVMNVKEVQQTHIDLLADLLVDDNIDKCSGHSKPILCCNEIFKSLRRYDLLDFPITSYLAL